MVAPKRLITRRIRSSSAWARGTLSPHAESSGSQVWHQRALPMFCLHGDRKLHLTGLPSRLSTTRCRCPSHLFATTRMMPRRRSRGPNAQVAQLQQRKPPSHTVVRLTTGEALIFQAEVEDLAQLCQCNPCDFRERLCVSQQRLDVPAPLRFCPLSFAAS